MPTILYNWLQDNYDRLINWQDRLQRELPGLMLVLPEPEAGPILDLGCGTGGHLKPLLERGYHAYGVDLSENIVKVAQKKLAKWNPPIVVGDMVDGTPADWKGFATQLCLGNTLSHLTPTRIGDFAEATFKRAKRGGMLIVENRNWDRLLEVRERFLKPVMSEDHLFLRVLDFPKTPRQPVIMTVALWHKDRWQSSSVPLWPIRAKKLENIFRKAGWKPVRISGNLAGIGFDPVLSTDWVSVWRKG